MRVRESEIGAKIAGDVFGCVLRCKMRPERFRSIRLIDSTQIADKTMRWTKRLQTTLIISGLVCSSGVLPACDSIDCTTLDQAECESSKVCTALSGRDKAGAWKYAGCIDSDNPQGGAITCAVDEAAKDECLSFSSTAVPVGWEPVPCDDARCPKS